MSRLTSRLTVLSDQEIDAVIQSAMGILSHRGAMVQNQRLCALLSEYGGVWDGGEIVRFPEMSTEAFLGRIDRVAWPEFTEPTFFSVAEVCTGSYLDPRDGVEKSWNENRFADYIKVARSLRNVDHVDLLGCPMEESPLELQPLYEKYFTFKYGVTGGAAIWNMSFCEPILRIFECICEETGKPMSDVFRGGVYLISPLRLAKEEAEQVVWFRDRGMRVHIGANGALGAGFPVTMAGALAIHLAEYLFIGMLNEALFGTRKVHLGWSVSPMDMRTGAFRYGRPEKSIANIAGAQIARRLGLGFSGHAGLTDACSPGFEAAAQKATSTLLSALSCGTGYLPAGLLAADEVFSPVQMVLDDEMLSSWHFLRSGMEVDEETLASDAIDRQCPGGNFLADEHTAEHYRDALWEPRVFNREMRSSSRNSGRTETDRARDIAIEAIQRGEAPEAISEHCQNRILAVIGRVKSTWS